LNIKGGTISHMAAVHPGALATGSPTERKKKKKKKSGYVFALHSSPAIQN